MATRKRTAAQWNALSETQRKRYVSAGRTGKLTGTPNLTPTQVRAYYLNGGDLGGGRGYHPEKNAAPKKATQAAMIGKTTSDQTRQLRQWRKREAPKWLPKDQAVMGDDTAAILASIGLQPKNWKDVLITANPDGSYTMTVTSKKSQRVRKVLLPDRDSLSEVRSLFNGTARQRVNSKKEFERLQKYWANVNGGAWQIAFDVQYGTPTKQDNAVPTTTVGTPLPRKARK